MSATDNPDTAIARCDKEMRELDELEVEIKALGDELTPAQRVANIVKIKWAKATFSKEKQGYLRLKKDLGNLEVQATDVFAVNRQVPAGIRILKDKEKENALKQEAEYYTATSEVGRREQTVS